MYFLASSFNLWLKLEYAVS